MDEQLDERHAGAENALHNTLSKCVATIESATVSVLGIQNDRFVHDRSGVLYKVAGRHFILTASHAGQGGDHDIRAIIHNGILHCVCVNVDGVLPIPLSAPAGVHGTEVDGRDIAAIYLPDDVAAKIAAHKRFVSLNEVLPDDGGDGWYVVLGYPAAWSVRKLGESFLYSEPLKYLCRRFNGDPDPQSCYESDVHVVLGFETNAAEVLDGKRAQLPKPYGISGCGVWRVADAGGLARASVVNASLVAIQNKWCEKREYIMATRINWVLNRIIDDYPEVERSMRLTYPRNVPSGRIIVGQPFGNWVAR